MHRFYINGIYEKGDILTVTGEDVNHIKNVLRMRKGDRFTACNSEGLDFLCEIDELLSQGVTANVLEVKKSDAELPLRITLFQGLPKKDKMELIIQKAVELGVSEIVPVMTKRVIVRLEEKKREEKLLTRWQAISESAAKQSKRGIIPMVCYPVSYKEALKMASEADSVLIPYEDAKGMEESRKLMAEAATKSSVAIFIGPEGGFEKEEVEEAQKIGAKQITLGKRILRTETAGLAIAAHLMLLSEKE